MHSSDNLSMRSQGLLRIAVTALFLVVFIPALGVGYIFWDQVSSNWLPLTFLLIISLLGFFVLWRILYSVSRIIHGLEKVARGEAETLGVSEESSQLSEMAEIIGALNKLTTDFQSNARHLETLIQQFSTLTELTEMTARIPDIKELLKLVLNKAMGTTHAKRGTVMLVREDGEGMEIVAAAGWQPVGGDLISFHNSLVEPVIESGEPLRVEDINQSEEIGRSNNSERYSSSSFLIMPLKVQTTTVGVVCMSEKEGKRSFTDQDTRFLTVLLGQIGYAVENARLLRQARNAAEALQEMVEHKESQLQTAQQQIVHSEKLSALGQLIAGVAHEINNPLTSVVGYTDLVLRMPDKNTKKADKNLRTVFEEASRATRIVQNLLSFARTRKSEKSMVDINEIVKNIVALREYELHTHDIHLKTELAPSLPASLVNADQIQQVLLNFVNNSVQALEPKGPRRIMIGTGTDEDNVLVWVEDTGKGMAPEVSQRVFEPFFTTKGETNKNSGLGLNISAGIIKEHGGEIRISSEVGKGTRMTIALPMQEGEVERREKAQEDFEMPRVLGKRALIVDDEEPIAELIGEILESVGYQVEVFNDGLKALDQLLTSDFDMVVTDMRMPEIDGQQIYQKIRTMRHKNTQNFVMTSGDVADPQVSHFAKNNNIPLLAKPFTRKQFIEVVFPALRQESPAGAETAP